MLGAEVITFPAGFQREGEEARAFAPVPIPSTAVGLEICFQWLAFDADAVVSSNIACMKVQPQ